MKILICEDELLIAENIKNYCLDLNYEVVGLAPNVEKAKELLSLLLPEIVLLDINLEGNKEGIELAQHINENYKIPFIFITAYSDPETLYLAGNKFPSSYIVKPVDEITLKINIELALIKFNNQLNFEKTTFAAKLTNSPTEIDQVDFTNCTYINANQNYIHIYFSNNKKCILRYTISDLESILGPNFIRVHKSYIANLKYVSTVLPSSLNVLGTWIPIGRVFKSNLSKFLDT